MNMPNRGLARQNSSRDVGAAKAVAAEFLPFRLGAEAHGIASGSERMPILMDRGSRLQ
jgi:hypothetical protein